MRWDRKVPNRKATIVIFCSALIVFVSMGIRQSFGLFLSPISQDLGIGREVFSLAIAWQNLIFGLPVLGIVADRFGPRWVVAGGALLYAVCFLLLSSVSTPLGLYTVLGVIIGSRYLSTLYGIVFFSHQIGSFLGVWLAGRVYDATGSYDMIWIAAILLAVTSSLVHLPIADKPLQRLETVRT